MEFALMFMACLCIGLCARIIYGNKKYILLAYSYNELAERSDNVFRLYWAGRKWTEVFAKDAKENEAIANEAMTLGLEYIAANKRLGYAMGYGMGYRKGLEAAGDIAIIQAPRYGKAIAKHLYDLAAKLQS
jgi:hypothetical protein